MSLARHQGPLQPPSPWAPGPRLESFRLEKPTSPSSPPHLEATSQIQPAEGSQREPGRAPAGPGSPSVPCLRPTYVPRPGSCQSQPQATHCGTKEGTTGCSQPLCVAVQGPQRPRWGWATIGPLLSHHTLTVTHSVTVTPSTSHTQPPLSRHQPHCHTFSHTQSCTATPSASNTACHTLSPRCRPQKYRHSLSDAGHTCLQPHRLIPRHADLDTPPPTPCQHHIDQQGAPCILGPGGCPCSCASHVATQSHCPARSQGGEANSITSAPGCGARSCPGAMFEPSQLLQ